MSDYEKGYAAAARDAAAICQSIADTLSEKAPTATGLGIASMVNNAAIISVKTAALRILRLAAREPQGDGS